MIPDGDGRFVKDDRGAVVLSKLDNSTLRELAQQTGGTYRDASSWLDLAAVLQATVEAGRKGEFMEKNTVRLVERFQWALAPALCFLLLSFWREFPVHPRPRELKLSATGHRPPPAGSVAPTTATPAKVAALTLLLLLSGLRFPSSASAATTAATEPVPQISPLGKIVSRLSAQDQRTGRDWAELARETVTWGQKLQSAQQPVPENPVRDALAAVDLGAALDAKTADWPKLRSELEALLKKPEAQKPPDQQPQDKDKDKQQKEDQQKQDSQNSDSQKQNSDQSQDKDQQSKSEDQKNSEQKPEDQKKDSAFGDMQDKQPPPPPSSETQKVGGTPEKKDAGKESADPALAMPLQKLDQLRNQDSPAKLFRLMEGEKQPAPDKKGKNW